MGRVRPIHTSDISNIGVKLRRCGPGNYCICTSAHRWQQWKDVWQPFHSLCSPTVSHAGTDVWYSDVQGKCMQTLANKVWQSRPGLQPTHQCKWHLGRTIHYVEYTTPSGFLTLTKLHWSISSLVVGKRCVGGTRLVLLRFSKSYKRLVSAGFLKKRIWFRFLIKAL